jgi:hypothetical protein
MLVGGRWRAKTKTRYRWMCWRSWIGGGGRGGRGGGREERAGSSW